MPALLRTDEIAEFDQQDAGATVDRRFYVAITEIDLRGIDVCLIQRHGSLVLVDHERLILRLLLGDRVFFRQGLVTHQVDLRLGEHRLIVGQLRFRLIERRNKGARIDQKQFLILLHLLAWLKFDLRDGPADLGLHGHLVDRLDSADRIDDVGDVLTDRFGSRNRNRAATRTRVRATQRQRPAVEQPNSDDGKGENDQATNNADRAPRRESPPKFHKTTRRKLCNTCSSTSTRFECFTPIRW